MFKLFSRTKTSRSVGAQSDLHQLLLPFSFEQQLGMLPQSSAQGLLRDQQEQALTILRLLKVGLKASTLVLLLSEPGAENCSIYAAVTDNSVVTSGTYPFGAGVLGSLKTCKELSLSPYRQSHPPIPYRKGRYLPGFFYARAILIGDGESRQKAILCIERDASGAFEEEAVELLDLATEQISRQITSARELIAAEFERNSLFQAFSGLHLLTPAHDLQSVYEAAVKAVMLVTEVDLTAFSFIEGEQHRIQYVNSDIGAELQGAAFELDESLVGQAVKYRRVVPDSLSNTGRFPVINGCSSCDGFRSLMVFPLVLESKKVLGVMIVAARGDGCFTRHQRDMLGMIVGQVAIKIDLANAHEQINRMTLTDPLTGIPNRRAFQRGFDAILERAQRREGLFSLIICDIDFFKKVNDVYGHSCGDLVLQQVARQMQLIVRTGDLAARVGGEEFAVLLEDSSAQSALEVAERLRRQIETLPLYWNGEALQVTLSLGIAEYPASGGNRPDLYERADKALYRAKQSGRNRSLLWQL